MSMLYDDLNYDSFEEQWAAEHGKSYPSESGCKCCHCDAHWSTCHFCEFADTKEAKWHREHHSERYC